MVKKFYQILADGVGCVAEEVSCLRGKNMRYVGTSWLESSELDMGSGGPKPEHILLLLLLLLLTQSSSAMRDKEDRESYKQMGKQQTERQTACCYRHSAIGMLRSMLPLQHDLKYIEDYSAPIRCPAPAFTTPKLYIASDP